MNHEIVNEVKRETGSGTDLWHMILAPILWACHFLLTYILVAVFCEKAADSAKFQPLQLAVSAATLLVLATIGWLARRLWRVSSRSQTDNDFEFEHNSPEERHRFLSHVALMLCVLSVIAVFYTALPVLYLGACR